MSCSVCAGYSSYNCPCCGEEVVMVDCPDCKGTGFAPYKAFHIHRREEVEVTELCWTLLPEDEDAAFDLGENYCQMPRETCRTCKGEGEIPESH